MVFLHDPVSAPTFLERQGRGASLHPGQWLLHDIYGREVLRHRISSRESEVDLTALATGVYMGRLITPKGMVIETGKIVKE